MKNCPTCLKRKPLSEFYFNRHSQSHGKHCKDCTKARVRANRREKIEYYREYDRERSRRLKETDPEAYKAKCRSGSKKAKERGNKAWIKRNPKKRRAHGAVQTALRNGSLEKPDSCESCGAGSKLEAHHHDYSQPLEVTWLCSPCHKAVHVAKREKARR